MAESPVAAVGCGGEEGDGEGGGGGDNGTNGDGAQCEARKEENNTKRQIQEENTRGVVVVRGMRCDREQKG